MNWVTDEIPTFAVVGKVNMGKSSVLATLLEVDDDRIIRISATPGETTGVQSLPVEFNGVEHIRFLDTPGFSRPIEAMRAIKEMAGKRTPGLEELKQFVHSHNEGPDFGDECRLLAPLLEGAGILYIVDPSKPLRDSFLAEMEILRWTGRHRLAILNEKGEVSESLLQEWRDRLGSYFNLVRTFNAHRARFQERRMLFKSLLAIDERHHQKIEDSIQLLDREWEQRRGECTEVFLTLFRKALGYREELRVQERDLEIPHRREQLSNELAERYYKKISGLERKALQKLLSIHRHTQSSFEVEAHHYRQIDLKEEEVWKKWGLSRSQLALVGGAAGAAAGAAVDIGTGGLTHGAGTLVGLLGGAAAAFFKGSALPDVALDLQKGFKLSKDDASALRLGPPANENFSWILLDLLLDHYKRIINRSHALRNQEPLPGSSEPPGLIQDISYRRRSALAKWFALCSKLKSDSKVEAQAYEVLYEILSEVR